MRNGFLGTLIALCLWGQDAATLLKQGDAQYKAGQYRQALDSYRKVTALDPKNSDAYDRMGETYSKLGMPGEAAKAYEKVAELILATVDAPQAVQAPHPVAPMATRPAPVAQAQARVPAPAPQAAGGAPNGLYLMTRYWPGSGLEMGAYLFRNGTVVRNPIGADIESERAVHPKEVGTFQLQGGNLMMNFAGTPQTARFESENGGCFGWDAGSFCPAEVFKPGATLDGVFEGGASVGGGAVMSSTAITFHADGSYTRESAASFKTTTSASTVSGGSTGADKGRYRIEGTALHLMPEGGKETVVSTFPYDDGSQGPAPRRVYFGGGMLKRIK